MASTSAMTPVTLDAAEKEPATKRWFLYFSSAFTNAFWSMEPVVLSSPICTTSAQDSRQGKMLEWCSCGPTRTTGCASRGAPGAGGRCMPRTILSLLMAAVEPLPANTTTSACLSEYPTRALHACAISWRASWRKHVDCRPHVLVVVCVLAYSGRTSSRT